MLILSFILGFMFASDVSINTNLYKNTNLDAYDLNIKVTGSGDIDLNTEKLEDKFRVINRGSSSSTSISIINGSYKKTNTKEFTLSILPLGNVKRVPYVIVSIDGKKYKTKEMPLSSASQQKRQNRRGSFFNFGGSFGGANDIFDDFGLSPSDTEIEQNDIFVKAIINKKNIFVGEQILLSFYIYKKQGVRFNDLGVEKLPDFKGFLKDELINTKNINFNAEQEIGGVKYQRALISKYLLYPVKSGKLNIGQISVAFLFGTNSFFSMGQKVLRRSKPISIHVKPLPKNAPAGFNGAIGSYTTKLKLDKKEIRVGDDVKLNIVIGGRGNLEIIELKDLIKFPESINVFDSKGKIRKNKFGVGEKDFQYVLVPQVAGKMDLGPWDFIYFDTKTNTYKTEQIGPIKLNVLDTSASLAAKAEENQKNKQDKQLAEAKKQKQLKENSLKNDDTQLELFSLLGFLFSPYTWIAIILLILIIILIAVKLTKKGKHERLKVLKLTIQNANKEFENENISMTVSLMVDTLKLLIAETFNIEESVSTMTLLELAEKYKTKKEGKQFYELAVAINKIRFSSQKNQESVSIILEDLNNMIAKIKK